MQLYKYGIKGPLFKHLGTQMMIVSLKRVALLVFLSAALSACSERLTLAELPTFTQATFPKGLAVSSEGQPVLQVTYTGTAGALLKVGENAVMLDPYFSNHNLSNGSTQSSEAVVDALLPDLASLKAILIGHAHADHLFDAPYVLSKAPAQAKIYGSQTTSNIIAPKVSAQRRVVLNDVMAVGQTPGRWLSLPGGMIRIMAIQSEHAPQLGPFLLGSGHVEAEQENTLELSDWKMGQPLTYLVDFLGKPVASEQARVDIKYRVFLQSSASGPQFGKPPQEVLAERPVDLALLCVASFNNIDNYPEHVIKTVQPTDIMLIHWDKFYQSRLEKPVELLPFLDVGEFIRRARAAMGSEGEILMPMPDTSFSLAAPTARMAALSE